MTRHWTSWPAAIGLLGAVLAAGLNGAPATVPDLSFEAGLAADGVPHGWKLYGRLSDQTTLQLEKPAHDGDYALGIFDGAGGERKYEFSVGVSRRFPVLPRQRYRAAVWALARARSSRNAVTFQLTFLPGKETFRVSLAPRIGGDYERFTLLAQAPPTAREVVLYIYATHVGTSNTLVDEVSLEPIAEEDWPGELLAHRYRFSPLDPVRPLKLKTELVREGRGTAVITVPAEAEYIRLADHLQKRLQELTGVALPVAGNPTVTELAREFPEHQVIALGQMINNRVIERLYWNHYTLVDSLFPGPQGFLIQTVHQPYQFPRTTNVIILGGSTVAGAARAVEAFLARLSPARTLIVPRIFEVQPAQHLSAEARAKLVAAPGPVSYLTFIRHASHYLQTGDEGHAEAARAALEQLWEAYGAGPERRLDWPEETSSRQIFYLWDVLEESPAFDEPDRRRFSTMLLGTLFELQGHVYEYDGLEDNDTIIWNHTTFPLLGLYFGARYFKQHYPHLDARLDEYLAKAAGAFGGQEKSYKVREDAAGYLTITTLHMIEYALAENDLDYFANGNLARAADYHTVCTDNLGFFSAFGDHPDLHSQSEKHILPYAFWFRRDGRFLWRLNRLWHGAWPNPYYTDVTPREPTELCGVKRMPLTREVYDFTTRRKYYGSGNEPPNVPFERTFDKISFRTDFDPLSQYLLLDGYGRGNHLHYDANMIIRLTDNGRILLCDADYLVRNTTEHSGISIVRDGRCAALMPVAAGCEACANLGHTGLTRTYLQQYNGTDWYRNIFWSKERYFVVLDQVQALRDGEYEVHCIWKTLDQGRERLRDDGAFEVFRPGERRVEGERFALEFNPAASGGRAVKFLRPDAALELEASLPAGTLPLRVIGCGQHGGNDSVYVDLDGKRQGAWHLPQERPGASSGEWDGSRPTPSLIVAQAGRHKLRISLREAVGTVVDRLEVLGENGRPTATWEAEDLLEQMGEPLRETSIPDQRFFIVESGAASSRVSRRTSSVGLKVKKLHQLLGAELQRGEEVVYQNLLYTSTDAMRRGLVRINPRAAVVTGPEPALVAVGGQKSEEPRLEWDASLCHLTPGCWSFARVTNFRSNRALLYCRAPCHVTAVRPRGPSPA